MDEKTFYLTYAKYEPMVYEIYNHVFKKHKRFREDLIQEGRLGLVKIIRRINAPSIQDCQVRQSIINAMTRFINKECEIMEHCVRL